MSGIMSGASAGVAPVDASIAGKSQTLVEPVVYSPCSKPQHTPMSQPSTAPSTPPFSFNLDAEGGHSIFYRCISGTSTIEPLMEQQESDEDCWEGSDLPPLPDAQLELPALDSKPSEVQGGTRAPTIASLEDQLAEVKELYKARTGRDVDSESEDEEYDSDGTLWVKTAGTGPLSVARLEDQLADVKALYLERFGTEVDDSDYEFERACDIDGTLWIKTTGTGPLSVARLEDQLAEVKSLYLERFGRDVDDSNDEFERTRDCDGTLWIKTTGTGLPSVARLEDQLVEVKALYLERFGREVEDSDDEFERARDIDGTLWIKTTGTGPLSIARLEDHLAEVKALYLERFGRDVDDSDDEFERARDSDGTLWIKTIGTGPPSTARLQDTLAEVKTLYREKFGRDLDAESDTDSEVEYDADGTPWMKTVGTGPLSMARLEDMLAEVKTLYREKFGCDADAESDDDSEVEYDADGTAWLKVVGQGPLTLSGLEDKLAEVKAMYREKFGRDVDAESGDDPEVEYDADGTPWIQTVGAGMPTAQALAEQQ